MGNIDLLDIADHFTVDEKDKITTIKSSGAHLLDLINDLLDVSSIDSKHLNLEKRTFDLFEVLEDCYKQCRGLVKNKSLDFILDCQDEAQKLVGDQRRIKQVIINLVSNAIKFIPAGYIKLKQHIKTVANNFCYFEIVVEDSGIGIPNDKKEFVFEKFNQVDSSLTRENDGIGLGLSIVREIIEEMGGNVTLKSKLKHGTTFTINLSLPIAINQTKINTFDYSGCRILLIEDNLVNMKVATTMLERINCVVDVAENGKEALEKFENHEYDIILTDISLPDIDGCEVTERMRKQNKSIPIIAITAHKNPEIKRKAFESGVDDILNKPLTQDILYEKLFSWYKHSSSVR